MSILVCVGPCFILTFITKWRQEQLRQKVIEDEKECDNGPPQFKINNGNSRLNLFKLYNGDSKLNLFGHRASVESQAILLNLKNSSSSAGSIYSLNGDFFFKQEKIGKLFTYKCTYILSVIIVFIACGKLADYWKGIYTGSLPCRFEKNSVCIKVSRCECFIHILLCILFYFCHFRWC